MKIIALNGSPKKQDSCSGRLLEGLKAYLHGESGFEICSLAEVDTVEKFRDCGAMVIAFPLYVDGIPSNLLAWMKQMEPAMASLSEKPMLYCILNAGFFEPLQNRHAVEIMKNWCSACGMSFGGAVACGAGGMINAAPVGKGPNTNLGKAFEALAGHIKNGQAFETLYVKPNFPRFLYITFAHVGWKAQGKSNGISPKALYARWQD